MLLPARRPWRRGFLLLSGAALIALGCGEPDKVGPTVPVVGKVTIDGAPVPIGNLVFKPDRAKGNNAAFEPVAFIHSDGTYTLKTLSKPGAPAGWYAVAIDASEPIKDVVSTGTIPKSYIPRSYNSETTSRLAVEVKAGAPPGSYDFALTSKK